MPELPEVQTIVNDLNTADLTGITISAARVFWPRTIAEPSHRNCSAGGSKVNNLQQSGAGENTWYLMLTMVIPCCCICECPAVFIWSQRIPPEPNMNMSFSASMTADNYDFTIRANSAVYTC